MPFTLAHPAAVLPLRRTKLIFSALVAGSIAPDLPYFLYATSEIRSGHSWSGVFEFSLPAGLAVLWIFHAVVKRPLVSLAPESMRRRISAQTLAFRFTPAARFLWIVASLLIGVLAHVLWDGFTHEGGYFARHWAFLSTPVITYREMPLWRTLQHVCSVLGVAAVAITTLWWWYRKPIMSEPISAEMTPRLRWFVVAVMVLLACMVGAAAVFGLHHHGWKSTLVRSVIGALSTGCAEILLYSIAWHWSHRVHRNEKPPDDVQRLKITTDR